MIPGGVPRCLAAVAAATTFAAHAAGLGGQNLGFETWRDGNPAGWAVPKSAEFAVSADCGKAAEGRCSLKLQSTVPVPQGFVWTGQTVDAVRARGSKITVSASIRTSGVDQGYARLWLRIDDATGKRLLLDNMAGTGASGSSDWTRYEISAVVPEAATRIVFGPLLKARGEAWFDDFRITSDRELAAIAVPERPIPSQALLKNAQLALEPSAIPHVPVQWKDSIQRTARPIRSLFSDDFSDLRFLKPLLAGKRVVQLGESAHGVAEFSLVKARLIRFLHQEMGFDVIAFESSLTGCQVANLRIGASSPIDVMRDCIFPVWHSTETLEVFRYLDKVRKAKGTLDLAGFDTQGSGRANKEVSELLIRYSALEPAVAEPIASAERSIAKGAPPADVEAASAAYRRLAEALVKMKVLPESKVDAAFVAQEARSRARLVQQLAVRGDPLRSTPIRDEGMADNLDFLLDRVYPGRKVIVWAHNFHIAKSQPPQNKAKTMGEWVAARRGAQVYTIGLYMGRGAAAWNDHSIYSIAPPPDSSLEAVMANAGYRYAFTGLDSGDDWTNETMVARDWGTNPTRIRPARAYDAIIYTDTVTPPQYLP